MHPYLSTERPRALATALGLVASAPILFLVGACGAMPGTGSGELVLRFVLPESGAAGFTHLDLEHDWAGATGARTRDEGWHRVDSSWSKLRLAADGTAVEVARGVLKAEDYTHVLATVPRATGSQSDLPKQEIISHVEPIARGFSLQPGSTVIIDIELVVQPRVESSGGGHQLFVKDARLVGDSAPPQKSEGASNLSRGPMDQVSAADPLWCDA